MGAGTRWWPLACLVAMVAGAGCDEPQLSDPLSLVEIATPALDYGMVALGSDARQPLVVRNVGRTEVFIRAIKVGEPFRVLELPEGGARLAAGESRSFPVVFAAPGEGRFASDLEVDAEVAEGLSRVPVAGQAVRAYVGLTASELRFGQVRIGSTRELSVEAANESPLAVTVQARVDGVDASQFDLGTGTGSITVGPGEHRALPISFRPNHLGTSEATLYVKPCPGCAEVPVALSGEGVASCIVADPGAVEFGSIDAGTELSQSVRVRNDGTVPVDVAEVFMASSSSPDFRVEGFTPGVPRTLAPGDALPLTVFFKPTSNGARSAAVRVRAGQGDDACWAEVRLKGQGGTGCLQVSPLAVDFGTVASGMSGRHSVFVANAACGSDVWVEGIELAGASEFAANTVRPAPFLLRQGENAEIRVSFSPAVPGAYEGVLRVRASDDQHRALSKPPGDVPLTGLSRALAPCSFTVAPPRLDFGAVDVNTSATLAFRITNTGQDACYFSNVGLTSNSSPAFKLAGASPGFMLEAGWTYDLRVAFSPTAAGSFTGALELYVSDYTDPYRTYAIAGQGVTGCLAIQPRDLDFGTVFVGCPPPTLASVVTNRCPGSVTLRSLVRGPGTSSEFTLPGAPAFPYTLAPGQQLRLDVRYAPTDRGLDSMPIFLDDGSFNHLLAARGEGVVDPLRTDSFSQELREKVDVLFVLDNSGSMADKQAAVGANLGAFLRRALTQNVDYQLAVITTGIEASTGGWTSCPGGADGGEGGRLFPVDGSSPRIITPRTPNPEAVWAKNTAVGVCHWLEQGLEASYRALSPPLVDSADDPRTLLASDGNLGFLRPDAKLALVYVSDEDDQSPGTVDFYLNFLRNLKRDPSMFSISVIVSPADLGTCPAATSSGTRYIELATRTGGLVESICTPDWAASLERLGNSAFGAQSAFPLSARPADPAQITVRVNGAPVSATGNWRYEPTTNAVIFAKQAIPGPGSHIEITYPLGCGS